MARTLDAALGAQHAINKTTNSPGKCLGSVDQDFGTPGNADGHSYPTAYSLWVNTPAQYRHPGDYNVPKGGLAVFGPSSTRHDSLAGAGDVAWGSGQYAVLRATDVGAAGKMGYMTIDARAKATSRAYLGWIGAEPGGTGYYCGFPTVDFIAAIGGPVAPPAGGGGAAGPLIVDSILGYHTILQWQVVMGTGRDGKISTPSQLVMAVQRKLNSLGIKGYNGKPLAVDGLGIAQNGKKTNTAYALQTYLGTPRDGIISSPKSTVIRALQTRLNTGTF